MSTAVREKFSSQAAPDVLGMHTVLMQRYGGALMERVAINYPFVDGNERIAFAAADLFLRVNGWRPQRSPMQIHAEMMRMFETGTFDIAHLDPWLRGLARAD